MGFFDNFNRALQELNARKEIKCDSGNIRYYLKVDDGYGKCPWCGKSISDEAIQDYNTKELYCSVRCFKKAR
ncbi:MAG: hypothetical protein IKK36_01885 [Bacteroidales bacterium]|nr:hypothetical protein [Bacteroidales bacterium]